LAQAASPGQRKKLCFWVRNLLAFANWFGLSPEVRLAITTARQLGFEQAES
jgi:hypothetical protein